MWLPDFTAAGCSRAVMKQQGQTAGMKQHAQGPTPKTLSSKRLLATKHAEKPRPSKQPRLELEVAPGVGQAVAEALAGAAAGDDARRVHVRRQDGVVGVRRRVRPHLHVTLGDRQHLEMSELNC